MNGRCYRSRLHAQLGIKPSIVIKFHHIPTSAEGGIALLNISDGRTLGRTEATPILPIAISWRRHTKNKNKQKYNSNKPVCSACYLATNLDPQVLEGGVRGDERVGVRALHRNPVQLARQHVTCAVKTCITEISKNLMV